MDQPNPAPAQTPEGVSGLRDRLEFVLGQSRSSGDATIPSLTHAAELLGVAPRTLQLHLARSGTTFRRVTESRRMHRAQRLLTESQTKITAIACEVGFSSLQHFSTWFKRATGLRPLQYRSNMRGAAQTG